MGKNAIEGILQMLAEMEIPYIFGNPGSTELPLMDALVERPPVRYILGLQEVPVMSMAEGYAAASGRAGVVNLHICCGLGNAMGMLYNAYRSGSPLIVTAGQQDRRLMFEEPILGGDMVAVTRPWTKWAVEVHRAADVPSAMRRAIQTALTPPTGPVFLSLPVDVQMEPTEADFSAPELPDVLVRPPLAAVRRAASVLTEASNPAVLVGSRICEAGAVDELVAVAERLGAPVIHEAATSHGRSSFPSHHPLAAPPLPYWSPDVRRRLQPFDVVLVAGMKLLQQYIHHEPSPIPEHIRFVHLDDDPWELGKNYPTEVGLIGHPKATLGELDSALSETMTAEQAGAARARGISIGAEHDRDRAALRSDAQSQRDVRPLSPLCLMESLARVLPDDVAVVEESPTTTHCYFERTGSLKNTSGYFAHRGWALGWGVGCSIGAKLAWPERPVLGIIGDGSAMYGFQGLWTAAHYGLPVTWVICANREYRILKNCAAVLGLPNARAGRFAHLDVDQPAIDFVGLAQSLGVSAHRVTEPDELSTAVSESLAGDKPRLIEVAVRQPEG